MKAPYYMPTEQSLCLSLFRQHRIIASPFPTCSSRSIHHSLRENGVNMKQFLANVIVNPEYRNPLTKISRLITPTLPFRPILSLRAMRIRTVLVSNFVKEMNLVFPCQDAGGDAVYWCIAPALYHRGEYVYCKLNGTKTAPRNRNRPSNQGIERIPCMLALARSPCLQFRSYSKLKQEESQH